MSFVQEYDKKIVLWGARGQAKVLQECLSYVNCQVIALFDNNELVPSPLIDVQVYYGKQGFNEWLQYNHYPASDIRALVAIGGERGRVRHELQHYFMNQGIMIMSVIHPTAFIAKKVRIGNGSQILAKSAVCVDANLGEACIINTGAIVDHDCFLGNGVHICPGSRLAGEIIVGDYSTIGTGSVILPRIQIGKNVIVGAGSVVTRNIPDNVVVYGNPAKFMRDNTLVEVE